MYNEWFHQFIEIFTKKVLLTMVEEGKIEAVCENCGTEYKIEGEDLDKVRKMAESSTSIWMWCNMLWWLFWLWLIGDIMIYLFVLLGIILGIVAGNLIPAIPYTYSIYLSVAILAALDSIFGAMASIIKTDLMLKFLFQVFW